MNRTVHPTVHPAIATRSLYAGRVSLGLLAVTVLAAPAAMGQSETYDYTGVVTAALNIPTGTPVTGTYTFDLTAAVPSQSSGVIPSGSYSAVAEGGPGLPFIPLPVAPAPSTYVFSSTAKIGSFSYSTPPPSAGCVTYCVSSVTVSNNGQDVQAARYDYEGSVAFGSWFTKVGDVLSGSLVPQEFDGIFFNITSLTPVSGVVAPEIDPASATAALALLLGGLAVLRGRRA